MTITIPLRTCTESNNSEHWRVRQRRAKLQRTTTWQYLTATYGTPRGQTLYVPPLEVYLARIAPRTLDTDNLQSALKHPRDGIADWLGIDDRDPRITWHYTQHKGAVREYGITIRLVATPSPMETS